MIDTTPPAIVCPSNLTVELTSAAGAAVIFTVQATDLCSGEVTVRCEPASGSVFAVGTTPVRCVATDVSGNTEQCSFQVTVRGALSIKTAVLGEMDALEAVGQARALSNAISRLRRSISANNWMDETHLKRSEGNRVFLNEAAAVQYLKKMLRAPHGIPVGGLPFQQWIDRLVIVDRTLAALVIAEAIEAGVEPHKIQPASDTLSAGDLAGNRQRSVRAILLYRDAWRIATRAIFRLQAP
ncbi:MAG TPA: HYR domain-containing protein [Candidatus Acidoferrum sp.]|nr:HYR domain-containing protein [Candidatus Acidoferrum sp.]